jgi:hypothetical protein
VRIVPIYFGGGVFYAVGDEYFSTLPDQYPADYYKPTSLQPAYLLGIEVDVLPLPGNPIERHGVYAEVVALHHDLLVLSENVGHLKLYDVLASGLGYRLAF